MFDRRGLFVFVKREEDSYASRGNEWRGQDSGPHINNADTSGPNSLNYRVAKRKKS